MNTGDVQACVALLERWAGAAEAWWWDVDAAVGLGCYGTGYNHWGVQTNQKYAAALATLAHATGSARWRARALAALRYSLATHVSAEGRGGRPCADGTWWGHTWISALGVERMMHGVALLQGHQTDADAAALRRVLTSEASHTLHHHKRGPLPGVQGDKWNSSGRNNPESNLWSGALLWRAAALYPDDPQAPAWRAAAERYLFNGVSVPGDAGDPRFVGANFFDSFALDHHGYLNVGYMVICASNAAMLHFDLKRAGLAPPPTLHHHQRDLWRVLRRMVFGDGRLARIGGDSRLRYTYCQEYLLPTLLYAADHHGDGHALQLARRQVELIGREAATNPDGSCFGARLAHLAARSPYYYCRVESDRACALSMAAAYAPLIAPPEPPAAPVTFEQSVAGAWVEPEHGAVLHRCPTRFASFAWRAHGLTQGLCVPPGRGDLAEWRQNLAGGVRFGGDDGVVEGGQTKRRRLLRHTIEAWDGGFVTRGAVSEGAELFVPEGLTLHDIATHELTFAALPDGHTVLGVQRVVAHRRAWAVEVKGLRLGVPNDVYNGGRRTLTTAGGLLQLDSPPPRDAVVGLGGRWANVDGVLGVVGLWGGDELVVDRSAARRGGVKLPSLFVEEVCWSCRLDPHFVAAGEVLLEVAWLVAASVDAAATLQLSEANRAAAVVDGAVAVVGVDGRRYEVGVGDGG